MLEINNQYDFFKNINVGDDGSLGVTIISGGTSGGTSSLWSTNVNGIHYNSGNVGIGTTTSSVNTKLQIEYDDASPERAFRIKNTNDGSQYNFRSIQSGGENLLRFDSDNTGISPLVVSSANKVGIGTNSLVPQATLHIYSTSGSQPIVLVEDEANPDTTPFVIDIDGNVGVGTGTPQNKVHFKGTTGELRIKLDDDNSNDTNQLILKSDEPTYTNFLSIGTTTLNAELQFGMVGPSSTSKVVGNPDDSFILASSAADSMNFINNAGVGTSDNIGFYAGKAIGTDLSANTSDLIILGDGTGRGNVGIGTDTPQVELHVKGDNSILRLETTSATNDNYVEFWDPSERKGFLGYVTTLNTDALFIRNEEHDADIIISTTDSGGTSRTAIDIDGNQNVDIQNGNLLVSGNISTEGQIKVGSTTGNIFTTNNFEFDGDNGMIQEVDGQGMSANGTITFTNEKEGSTYTLIFIQGSGLYDVDLGTGYWLNDTSPFDFTTLADNERAMITATRLNSVWYFAVKELIFVA